LIAVRKHQLADRIFEKYYPPSLTLPMTAFFDVAVNQTHENEGATSHVYQATLKLLDPLERTVIRTGGRSAPLESDITTPLAFYMDDPLLNTSALSTLSMLDADTVDPYYGLYMLEPFDPEKIPVVMVHGLWSSPLTWLHMFNDLRASPELRARYQFWFYMYPTGQPFWVSARDMRRDLAQALKELDPQDAAPALKRIVLVGHSMGGLISRLQTMESGSEFWKIVSDQPFDRITGDPKSIEETKDLFFFEANPSIERVITIATPHQGSKFANTATRWLSHQAFTLPDRMTKGLGQLAQINENVFRDVEQVTGTTSIDSLSPESPFIEAMQEAETSARVVYNNIYGVTTKNSLIAKVGLTSPAESDGVVAVESARLAGAQSELPVNADHSMVHQHPECIFEVRRLLEEHLKEK
jgi:hypothetical protein